MMRRIIIRVTGEVQGVGYRSWVYRRATRLGVSGVVRNEPDGSVTVVAEGDEEALRALVEECRRGPGLAKVACAEVSWGEFRGEYRGFEVEYGERELPR
jgi:acylphosphatase